MKKDNYANIVSGLEQYWSPEQIIGHHGMKLCTATIYRALESGLIPIILQEKLRQHGKSRKAKGEEQKEQSRIAYLLRNVQARQLPDVALVIGKAIQSQENGKLDAF